MANPSYTVEIKGKNPFVVLALNEYEELRQYIEDLEDRLAIMERADEPSYDLSTMVKEMDVQYGVKRDVPE